MNTLGMLARAGNTQGAAVCPHPAPLLSCAILVPGRRGFICCPTCYQTMQRLKTSWHEHELGARQVVAQMFALGYTRGDAYRFLGQLAWDRLQVRLGLLDKAAL